MRIASGGMALLLAGMLGLISCSSDPEAKPKPRGQVLVFSKTAGFRHDSIPAGIAAIRSLGRGNGFSVSATENAKTFSSKRLRTFDAATAAAGSGFTRPPTPSTTGGSMAGC